ncbi:hypothetical protein PGT21_012878 [Puccinia graminis f. sp. tritici]|uniref:Uncharacterized protein n=1 Tax=Puccinia graminis f. sp. tritici TaxID=56615 RepID=A0A5B0MUC2_PUCGR|nr:hypothetical protein PGT21_012878 [Puccinia graminis f. sp. tritici]
MTALNSQAINFLNSQHQQSYQLVVDFDRHAVFLMQEFQAEDTIQQIITMISTTFTQACPPTAVGQCSKISQPKKPKLQTTSTTPQAKAIWPQAPNVQSCS